MKLVLIQMMIFLLSLKFARHYFMNKLIALRKQGMKNSLCQWNALMEQRYANWLAHIFWGNEWQ